MIVGAKIKELELQLTEMDMLFDSTEEILKKFVRKVDRKYPYFNRHASMGQIIVSFTYPTFS